MTIRLINRNSDYAVRALCYIVAREDKEKRAIISVAELVKKLRVPRAFMRKILQILNNEGILSSKRGIGGGFKLARAPENVHLIEIVEIFQGPFKLSECIFKNKACPNRKVCLLKKKLDAIEKFAANKLKPITIREVADGSKNVL